MIRDRFFFFWSGGPISYLRYLTVLSLRKHHPNSLVELYTSSKYTQVSWSIEQQDFQSKATTDYTRQCYQLCDKVIDTERYAQYAPNFQSDWCRWEQLLSGGWYLDLDQIIIKPFDCFAGQDFVYAEYGTEPNHVHYAPVGVIGASANSPIVNYVISRMRVFYTPADYNSIGPWMFLKVLQDLRRQHFWSSQKTANTDMAFYSIPYSFMVNAIYDGRHQPAADKYALHWFAGHPWSQTFNRQYTPEMAKNGNDTISRLIRMMQIS